MAKRLVTYTKPGTVLFGIRYEGGAQTPPTLRGSYTSVVAAEQAIERFLSASNRKQGDGK